MYRKDYTGWTKHLDFTIIDVLLLQLAFITGYIARHGWLNPYASVPYLRLAVILVLLDLCVVFFKESYHHIIKRGRYAELQEVATTCTIIFVGMLVYLYAAKLSAVYSRESLFTFWVMSIVYEYVVHCIYKRFVRNYIKKKRGNAVMIILTVSRYAEECVRNFEHDAYREYEVGGIVIVDKPCKGQTIRGLPVVANADDFYEYVRTHVVDEVFINGNTRDSSEALANQLIEFGITVHFNLVPQSALMPNKVVEKYGNYMVLTTSMHIASPPEMFFKRLMDIAGSLAGLVFTAAAFLIFAPIIKIQSPGPVLFSQERVGKNGRIFRIYKFRSMYVDADKHKQELMGDNEMDGLMFKMTDDPRIFPAGHFIRKYSIDELPQFWNILKGDMSLVGTRPPTVDEVEHYQLHHRARLGIKPGLTGMWQVSGRNKITDFEEVVALDTQYIAEWSLSLDIKILLKTIQVVLSGEGSK
ncbi:MAG: sugar transferase [Eubacterium sp.]|nr:sugar transferase [Eubacterium sp.]MCI8917180.1 sugar transferase [Eubacterium sp.]